MLDGRFWPILSLAFVSRVDRSCRDSSGMFLSRILFQDSKSTLFTESTVESTAFESISCHSSAAEVIKNINIPESDCSLLKNTPGYGLNN